MPPFEKQTIEISYTLDGVPKTKKELDDGNYYFSFNRLTCEDGVTAEWDRSWRELYNINDNGVKDIKCTVDYKSETTVREYLTSLVNTSSDIIYDETKDKNLRYIGSNPNNYVRFNNELWRIIGDSRQDYLKIIRNESIGQFYYDKKDLERSYDALGSSNSYWKESQLMMMLNDLEKSVDNYDIPSGYKVQYGEVGYHTRNAAVGQYHTVMKKTGSYWNRTTGYAPAKASSNGTSGSFVEDPVDFSNIGLTSSAKSLIEYKPYWSYGNSNNDSFHNYENGKNTAQVLYDDEEVIYYSDGSKTPGTSWRGAIALINASDAAFATGGGPTTSREECLNLKVGWWYDYSDCYENNWLMDSDNSQWTMTSSGSTNGFYVWKNIIPTNAKITLDKKDVRPVVQLVKKLKIIGGSGTSSDPYTLERIPNN